jgi:hypothetical protein
VGAFTNLRLLGVIAVSAAVQLALPYVEGVRALFQLDALDLPEMLVALALGLVPVTAAEVAKLLRRRGSPAGREPPGEGAIGSR